MSSRCLRVLLFGVFDCGHFLNIGVVRLWVLLVDLLLFLSVKFPQIILISLNILDFVTCINILVRIVLNDMSSTAISKTIKSSMLSRFSLLIFYFFLSSYSFLFRYWFTLFNDLHIRAILFYLL